MGLSWLDGILMLVLCITLASTGKHVEAEILLLVLLLNCESTSMLCVYLHVCAYECLCVCMCVHVCVHAAVIRPPKSQVAFPGTVVNYVCQGDDTIDLVLNGSVVRDDQPGATFLSKGINFTYVLMGGVGVYTITINASVLNNGTFIFCLDVSSKSSRVYIYTAEGMIRMLNDKTHLYEYSIL